MIERTVHSSPEFTQEPSFVARTTPRSVFFCRTARTDGRESAAPLTVHSRLATIFLPCQAPVDGLPLTVCAVDDRPLTGRR